MIATAWSNSFWLFAAWAIPRSRHSAFPTQKLLRRCWCCAHRVCSKAVSAEHEQRFHKANPIWERQQLKQLHSSQVYRPCTIQLVLEQRCIRSVPPGATPAPPNKIFRTPHSFLFANARQKTPVDVTYFLIWNHREKTWSISRPPMYLYPNLLQDNTLRPCSGMTSWLWCAVTWWITRV